MPRPHSDERQGGVGCPTERDFPVAPLITDRWIGAPDPHAELGRGPTLTDVLVGWSVITGPAAAVVIPSKSVASNPIGLLPFAVSAVQRWSRHPGWQEVAPDAATAKYD